MSEVKILPVMRLEAEKLLDGDGEYAVDFVKPGWLSECRKNGGTFLLYPQTSVDALAAQRDEGLAREAELHNMLERQEASAQTLHEVIGKLREERDARQQRLADAEKQVPLLKSVAKQLELFHSAYPEQWVGYLDDALGGLRYAIEMLARPGCADGEKAQ